MKPQSVSEQMMNNTVRISTESGCGTGSFLISRLMDMSFQ